MKISKSVYVNFDFHLMEMASRSFSLQLSFRSPFARFAHRISIESSHLRVGQQVARAALAYAQRSKLEADRQLASGERACPIDYDVESDFMRLARAKNIDVRTDIRFPTSHFDINDEEATVKENLLSTDAAIALRNAPENRFEVIAMCTGGGKTLLQICHALDLIQLHGARENGPSVFVAIPNVAGRENFLSYFGVVENGVFTPFEDDNQLESCALIKLLGLTKEQAKELCARVFFFDNANAHDREAFERAWIVVGYVGTLAVAQQHLVDVPFALFDEGDVGTMGQRSALASVRGGAVNGRRNGEESLVNFVVDAEDPFYRPWRALLDSPRRILCVFYSATLRNSRFDELPPPRVRVTYAHCLEAGDVKQIALNVLCRPANNYHFGFTSEERKRLLRDDQALFEMLVMAFQVYAEQRAASRFRSSVTVAPSTIVPLARVLGELGQVIVFAPKCFEAFEQTLIVAKRAAQRAGLCLADSVSGIHTRLSARDNAETLDRFNDGTLRVLVVVDMLGRSYDNKHVDCVVHVRPASQRSYESFMQRTGRALRVLRREDCRNDVERQLFDENQFDCGAQQACVILLDINNPEPVIDRLLCAESLHNHQLPRADVWLRTDGSLHRVEEPQARALRWSQQQEEANADIVEAAPRNVFQMLDRARSHQTLVVRCPYQSNRQFGWFVSVGQSLRALHMSRFRIKVESFDRDRRSLGEQVSKRVYENDEQAAWTMNDNRLMRQHGWVRVDAVPGATSLAVRVYKEGVVVVEKEAVAIPFDARLPLLRLVEREKEVEEEEEEEVEEEEQPNVPIRRRIRPMDCDPQVAAQSKRRRRAIDNELANCDRRLDQLAIDDEESSEEAEEESNAGEEEESNEESDPNDDDFIVHSISLPSDDESAEVGEDDEAAAIDESRGNISHLFINEQDDEEASDSDSECAIDADRLPAIAGNVESSQVSLISANLCLVQTRNVDENRFGLFHAHFHEANDD